MNYETTYDKITGLYTTTRVSEHPQAAGFRDMMREVREDMAALNGEVHEFCAACGFHHVAGKPCGKGKG